MQNGYRSVLLRNFQLSFDDNSKFPVVVKGNLPQNLWSSTLRSLWTASSSFARLQDCSRKTFHCVFREFAVEISSCSQKVILPNFRGLVRRAFPGLVFRAARLRVEVEVEAESATMAAARACRGRSRQFAGESRERSPTIGGDRETRPKIK